MFADKETAAKRAELAAIEWDKAKRVWRRFGAFLLALAILIAMGFAYLAGDLNGRLDCLQTNRPERSTP